MSAAACQCQSGGFSINDLVTILLAAAAFVVSVASLYLTSLRRPEIDVDHAELVNPYPSGIRAR